MKSRQTGFTMIELIIVIVILGVLAATALPKFIDLGNEAKDAALKGVAGAAASAMTINYGGCSVTNNLVSAKCATISNCSQVGNVMQGGLPVGYNVTPAAIGTGASGANGSVQTCVLTPTSPGLAASAGFAGISAGL